MAERIGNSTTPIPATPLRGHELVHCVGRTAGSSLWRARRTADRTPVLLKLVAPEAAPEQVARLRKEYELLASLHVPGLPRPLAFVTDGSCPAIVLENVDGDLLEAALTEPVSIPRALRIGHQLAEALGGLHEAQLVHRDLRPANLLIARDGDRIQVVDLSRAAPPGDASDETLQHDLAYIAPEQTGRVRHGVDARTDLYALGVILFRMISGALPFTASDPLEWVHCHLARTPTPLAAVAPVPPQISEIVMKLLGKTPEERYQSARGVAADLHRCLADCETGKSIARFSLGASDISDRIAIPHKLYGRGREIAALEAAYDRVAVTARTEIVLVAGHAGMGKSSLVEELRAYAVGRGGFFVAGKFDQRTSDIPYATFAQALRGLVQQLLSGGEDEVARWRVRLREALGASGQLMVAVVPELELLIGRQPPVPEVGLVEAQNRFHAVFRRFLGVFARREHPLVVFIDDLQWLDPASRHLLEHLGAHHHEERHLLIVGAYRDNEVSAAHPLALTLAAIRSDDVRVSTVELGPMSREDVAALVSDTLRCGLSEAADLADAIHDKTAGNPFFAIQFLLSLHDEGLIALDRREGRFRWDLARLGAKNITDNVVDLVVVKLRRLPAATQRMLAEMACLGTTAETTVLTLITGGPDADIHATLAEAVRARLVVTSDDRYRFVHDRVQEASYALLTEEERADTHARLARRLTAALSEDALVERVFEVVEQWNRALGRVTDPDERATSLRLHVLAGRKAQSATAYASARTYFARAVQLLPPDAWTAHYEDTLGLYLALAECESFAGAYQPADERLELALAHARGAVDAARVQRLRIRLYQLAGRQHDAVTVLLEALRALGVTVPESAEDQQRATEEELHRLPALLGGRRIADLVDAPVSTDPNVGAVVGLLEEGLVSTVASRPTLFPLAMMRAATLSIQHGNVEGSPGTYSGCAMALASMGDIATAHEFSELALRLSQRFERTRVALAGKLRLLHATTISIWREHVSASVHQLDEAFAACLDAGDLLYAGYVVPSIVELRFESGEALDSVAAAAERCAAFARETHNEVMLAMVVGEQQLVARLRGTGETPSDAAVRLATLTSASFYTGVAELHALEQIAAFVEGRYEDAWRSTMNAATFIAHARSLVIEWWYDLYRGLTAAALCRDAAPDRRRELAAIVDDEVQRHERSMHGCPENFTHRHALLSAELARIEGRADDAARCYERAIGAARQQRFVHHEALGWELASRFYRDRGLELTADVYLREARACYRRWGAEAKVRQIDRERPQVATARPPDGVLATRGPSPGAPAEIRIDALALLTVIKASQAISQEIVLDELITTLMRVVLESAGAQVAALLLMREEQPALAAVASIEGSAVIVRRPENEPTASKLPSSVLNYVRRSKEPVLLADASQANPFSGDPYLIERRPRSLLCLPIVRQTVLIGLLYVENTLVADAFPADQMETLTLLAGQAAISLENARLYADLQRENRERQQAEAALEDSQALLQSIIDTSTTVIYVKDLEGRFLLANRHLALLLQRDRDSLLGKTDYDLFPREQADAYRAIDLRVVAEGVPIEAEEVAPGDDGVHTFLSVKAPLLDPTGKPYALCAISTDITARKRAEAALRHTEAQLRQAQKMEAIGNLAGGVAHDFNNLLTVILSYSALLAADMSPSDPSWECVDAIKEAGQRAAALTQQLLAFGRKQVLQPRILDLNEVVAKMERMLRRLIGEDIDLIMRAAPALDKVCVDPGQAEQILMNLAVNSRDAMPAGGKLIVETANVVLDERYASEHVGVTAGPHVLLAVSDTGVGMDAETQARVFEPFFTTKEPGKGTGLGLSTVFGIVKQSGGSIWVYSEAGKGTSFKIYFPRAQGPVSDIVEAPSVASITGSETILLVEDDPRVRSASRTILERAGYHVIEADNGHDALIRSEQHPASIHLLLTDVVMPGMGGRDLAERLRAQRPATKVLFVSGYTDDSIVHHGVLDAGVEFLQKPLTPSSLLRRVREVLDAGAPPQRSRP
jgi:PAS domain S-box-containing protein